MKRHLVITFIFGVVGTAILVSFGYWQLQRLQWKQGVLAEIATKLDAPAVSLPLNPTVESDRYLAVWVSGQLTDDVLGILTSRSGIGPGIRIIQVMETNDKRRVMVDRGFWPDPLSQSQAFLASIPQSQQTVTGHLHWPDETDNYTPSPDQKTRIWFARDVKKMALALHAEPVLIIAASDTGDGITAIKVDDSDVPNNHLGYAVQWFMLATVWSLMTGYYIWRNRSLNRTA